MEKDLYVFICEDKRAAQEIIQKYFNKDQITYSCIFRESERLAVTDALDKIDAEREYKTE